MTKAGDLLTFEEAAALFPGKNVRWVRDKLVKAGRVAWVSVLGTRYVVRSSLEDFVARNLHRPHVSILREEADGRVPRMRAVQLEKRRRAE